LHKLSGYFSNALQVEVTSQATPPTIDCRLNQWSPTFKSRPRQGSRRVKKWVASRRSAPVCGHVSMRARIFGTDSCQNQDSQSPWSWPRYAHCTQKDRTLHWSRNEGETSVTQIAL